MLRSRSVLRRRRGRWVGKLTADYSSSSSPKKKLSEHFFEQKWRPKACVEQLSHVHVKQIGHFWRSLSSSLALQAKHVWAVTASAPPVETYGPPSIHRRRVGPARFLGSSAANVVHCGG